MNIRKWVPGLWAVAMLSVGGVAWACDGPSTGPHCENGICCTYKDGVMTCVAYHIN